MKTILMKEIGSGKAKRIAVALILALVPLVVILPLPALTAAITVDTLIDESDGSCTDGDCSLRDAIAVAAAGDTINFDVTGTITLTLDQLTIDKHLTITGPGAGDLTISGDETHRVFWINEDVHATLSGITIADGRGEDEDGGGIFNRGGMLTVSACTFNNNSATYDGGAISNRFDGTLHVADSAFVSNTSRRGAGIDNRDPLIVANSAFTGNVASTWGGGIYNYKGVVTVTGSTFSKNGDYTDAGGGINNHKGRFDLRDSVFSANNADGADGGGGVYNEDQLTVVNSDFLDNTASRGGGITNNGALTITGSTFSNNSAMYGGGIENFSDLSVRATTFYSNTVVDTGGGICNHGSLTVTNSTFYSNTAGPEGAVSTTTRERCT